MVMRICRISKSSGSQKCPRRERTRDPLKKQAPCAASRRSPALDNYRVLNDPTVTKKLGVAQFGPLMLAM